MIELLRLILHIMASLFKPRTKLVAEILILRQQLNVLRRQVSKRPQLSNTDRFLLVGLYRWFPSVLSAIAILRPETIIRWHRAGFQSYWRERSRKPVGRPRISAELRNLIGAMSHSNHLWGAPHIHGELLKLGFTIAQSTVARYMYPGVAAIAGLADLSDQSCRWHRGNRPLRAADDNFPAALLPCDSASRASTVQPRSGFRTRSPRRSRGTVHLVILFGTGTLRMARSSCSGCAPWAFGTSRLLPDRRGRTRTLRD